MKPQRRSLPLFFASFFFFFAGTCFLMSLFFIKDIFTPLFRHLSWGFIFGYALSFIYALIALFREHGYKKIGAFFILILIAAVTFEFYIRYIAIMSLAHH